MMDLLADKYALYVLSAYGATLLIVGGLVLATVRANARARAALEALEKGRRR